MKQQILQVRHRKIDCHDKVQKIWTTSRNSFVFLFPRIQNQKKKLLGSETMSYFF